MTIARADDVRVMLGERASDHLTIVATCGSRAEVTRNRTVPVEGTAAGDAFRTGRPLLVDDASTDPRVYLPAIEPLQPGPVIYAPMIASNEALGVLSVDNAKGGRAFDPVDLEVVASFARQAALAIDLGRSRGDRERIRMLEDRERIGRDLHDTVIQRLVAVGMQLQAGLVTTPPDQRERIERSIDEIDATIKEIRTSSFTLSTPTAQGLRREIVDLVDDYAARAGFAGHVTFSGPVDTAIGPEIGAEIRAVVREAVSNVARHACARRIEVTIAAAGDVLVRVADDGRGIDPAAARRSGLRNLSERAVALGGTCEVASSGTGTTLTWRVPGAQ
jgi:signal transduction histidine kinase